MLEMESIKNSSYLHQKFSNQSKVIAMSLKLSHSPKTVAKCLKLQLQSIPCDHSDRTHTQGAIYRNVHSRNDPTDQSLSIPYAPLAHSDPCLPRPPPHLPTLPVPACTSPFLAQPVPPDPALHSYPAHQALCTHQAHWAHHSHLAHRYPVPCPARPGPVRPPQLAD